MLKELGELCQPWRFA